jgi:hypothetical protein
LGNYLGNYLRNCPLAKLGQFGLGPALAAAGRLPPTPSNTPARSHINQSNYTVFQALQRSALRPPNGPVATRVRFVFELERSPKSRQPGRFGGGASHWPGRCERRCAPLHAVQELRLECKKRHRSIVRPNGRRRVGSNLARSPSTLETRGLRRPPLRDVKRSISVSHANRLPDVRESDRERA